MTSYLKTVSHAPGVSSAAMLYRNKSVHVDIEDQIRLYCGDQFPKPRLEMVTTHKTSKPLAQALGDCGSATLPVCGWRIN